MTRIYVMESCPDCIQAKQLYGDNPDYEIIDIGKQARDLKEFLSLRDNHPAFAKVPNFAFFKSISIILRMIINVHISIA